MWATNANRNLILEKMTTQVKMIGESIVGVSSKCTLSHIYLNIIIKIPSNFCSTPDVDYEC